jgi:hypothetical protein
MQCLSVSRSATTRRIKDVLNVRGKMMERGGGGGGGGGGKSWDSR